jgi:PAS domain S-box-containing protein
MFSLDMRTAIFSYVLITIISTFVITLLLKQYRSRYKGVHYMLICFALQTISLIMILLRGTIPGWISFDLSNTISVAGIIFFYVGLESYTGQKSSLIPNLILLTVFAAIHSWFTFGNPNLAARNLNVAIVWLLIFLQCTWLLIYRIPQVKSRLTQPVNMVCLAYCIVCIVRIIKFFIFGHKSEDYFSSDWFDTGIILISQILLILLIFSLEHMFSSQLLEDIKTEEEKFSKAFHTSPYGVSITRLSDGKIVEINKGVNRITGYSDDEVYYKSTLDLNLWQHIDDRHQIIEEINRSGKVYEREVQFRKKSGEEITVLLSAEVITVNNERCLLSSFDDITERKKHVNELIKAKEKAEESDKLKTAFLHNISHEIRTPMNAIIGFSALLGEPDLRHEDQVPFINNIQQSSNHLLSIITDIINISNIEADIVKINMTEINLNSKLKSLYEQFLPDAIEKNISLSYETTLDDKKSVFLTDSSKLVEILSNLIGNALKFTEHGHIRFGYDVEKNSVRFYVSDTGIGISANQHVKIFDRFYQVENNVSRQYEGTGLGLAICKSYVELLGGKIWLTSEKKGSVFYFTIPFNLPDQHNQPEENPIVDKTKFTDSRNKTIIVAEDNEMNYFLIEAMLAGRGLNILHAWDGSEVVDMCKRSSEIDLILMDIKMPVMDGFEATRKIKEMRPDLPIIAQTAYALAGDHDKMISAGCDAYIAKPIKKDKLITLLNSYLKFEIKSGTVFFH